MQLPTGQVSARERSRLETPLGYGPDICCYARLTANLSPGKSQPTRELLPISVQNSSSEARPRRALPGHQHPTKTHATTVDSSPDNTAILLSW